MSGDRRAPVTVFSIRGGISCHHTDGEYAMNEIYVSTDVEADGPIPGPHSMLSVASAAYRPDKSVVATFSVNLETLPGANAFLPLMTQ